MHHQHHLPVLVSMLFSSPHHKTQPQALIFLSVSLSVDTSHLLFIFYVLHLIWLYEKLTIQTQPLFTIPPPFDNSDIWREDKAQTFSALWHKISSKIGKCCVYIRICILVYELPLFTFWNLKKTLLNDCGDTGHDKYEQNMSNVRYNTNKVLY